MTSLSHKHFKSGWWETRNQVCLTRHRLIGPPWNWSPGTKYNITHGPPDHKSGPPRTSNDDTWSPPTVEMPNILQMVAIQLIKMAATKFFSYLAIMTIEQIIGQVMWSRIQVWFSSNFDFWVGRLCIGKGREIVRYYIISCSVSETLSWSGSDLVETAGLFG